ncbi:MAG TPA: Crp/Fnr family transcriptional regulator [Chloroflexota bacterium]|nr:Crp/Fnr family transcriptional regulator [Chloroflexota bacterium]HZU07879.1 Crp/Fnr family transcriptional regulator [Chloroflexota bacterium]
MQDRALRQVPLFAELPPERIQELAQMVRRRTYHRGETIFHKGDPGSGLYILTGGQVKIVLPSETGEEALLAVLEAGDFFGELALFDGLPRSATVVAVQNAEVLVLHRDDFLGFVARNPEVAIALFGVLSRRLRAADELIQDAVFLDVPGRLAKRLLELAERHGRQTPQGIAIELKLTQQDLAAMIGATRESVNKHLGWMRDRRLIALDRQRITVLRPDELRKRIYY